MQTASGLQLSAAKAVPVPLEPALRYDPEAIAQQYRGRFWQVWRRQLSILWPCLLFTICWWWDRKTKHLDNRRRAIQLREILTRLGPAYIKIGQALSTRPDLLPSMYLDEFAKLQDQLPPFANEIAHQFIEAELGAAPDQIYAELSPEPIAAASLGQVYQGRLKTGEVVAVKVQRPDLAEKITLDIYILRRFTVWLQKRFRGVQTNVVAILDEFATRLFEEMDYIQEGQNAERFARLYASLPNVYVPRIYWDYTNRRVLTMEWITGTKLTDLEALQNQGINARALIEVGIQCSLRQLLEHGFFHADPHPGNLLVTPTGKLAYLDFGMMSEIQKHQQYGLISAIIHIVNRDFEALVQDYIELEFLPPTVDEAPITQALALLFNDALTASITDFNFQVVIQKISELMYEYPFQMPAYYALVIRSLVTLEGIAIKIDPNFKVLNSAYPYVAKRLLTDPAPELRLALYNLLFKEGRFRWQRLEKLLNNARNTDEYDVNTVLNQVIDFLLSERGEFIRLRLADELVKILDTLGQTIFDQAMAWLPIPSSHRTLVVSDPQVRDSLHQIWRLLQESPGFDPEQLVWAIVKILTKPETHQTGQYVVGRLLQRGIARLVYTLMPLPQSAPQSRAIPTALPAAKQNITLSGLAYSRQAATTER